MKMKFNHCLAALIVLATFVFTSCGDELSLDITETPSTNETTVSSAVLRFATIEDFESMKASDISKDYEGFELNSLRYECVDTINMRALLLNVEAQLTDVIGANVNVSFTAEVGPELVSVEYYPGGEMIAAHDNMVNAFYPHVERYRNYSDGSRIGPDMFYDLGHPIEYSPGHYNMEDGGIGLQPYIISHTQIDPSLENALNFGNRFYYYIDDCFYAYSGDCIGINVNATILGNYGNTFTGEDLMPNNPVVIPCIYGYEDRMKGYEYFTTNFYGIDEYGYDVYRKSRIYGDEYFEYLNMCKDVPDISPSQFPTDTHDLRSGYYYGYYCLYSPNDVNYLSRYLTENYPNGDAAWMGPGAETKPSFYHQYLVIDGRIIHFNNIVNYQYLGISVSVNRIDGGYLLRKIEDFNIYGETFKTVGEIEVMEVEGEHILYEFIDYNGIENIDNEELNQLNSSTRSKASVKDSYERQDDESMVIDKTLPSSISNISRTRTIYSKDK